jgi:hypothetical protein
MFVAHGLWVNTDGLNGRATWKAEHVQGDKGLRHDLWNVLLRPRIVARDYSPAVIAQDDHSVRVLGH